MQKIAARYDRVDLFPIRDLFLFSVHDNSDSI
jgi:hypothetical protein